jgi:hypothetical protein
MSGAVEVGRRPLSSRITVRAGWPRAALWSAAFVVLTALEWLRMPGSVRDTLYAEDGRNFVSDWLTRPSWSLPFQPYVGYLHVVPRLGAWIATRFPPGSWAVLANLFACAVVAGVCLLTFGVCGAVVRTWPARVALGLLPLLVPITRLEAVGSIANLHWYALYLTPWLLLARPRSRAAAVGLAVAAALGAASEPQVLLYLPLVIWVFVRRRSWVVAAGWAAGLVGQAIAVLTAPVIRSSDLHDAGSSALGFTLNAVATTVLPRSPRWVPLLERTGWTFPILATVVLLAAAGAAFRWGGPAVREAVVVVVAGSVACWCAAWFLNDHQAFLYADMPMPGQTSIPLLRWGTGAALLITAVVPLLADALAGHGRVPRRIGTAMVVVLLLGMAVWFDRADMLRGDLQWPATLDQARQECAAPGAPAVVEIPENPGGWTMRVGCRFVS